MSRKAVPLKELDPRANPFELTGGPEAALLIHGFTGTCAEMLPIGQCLSKEFGWQIACPLLPGHGTTIQELEKTKWTDWLAAAENAWARLAANHEKVHLVGLSMGALLSLELFRKHPTSFQSLTLLVPAIYLKTWFQSAASEIVRIKWIARFVPPVGKATPNLKDHVAYDKYPPIATGELARLTRRVRSLTKIQAPPTFLCYSDTDEVVHPRSAAFLAERLKSPLLKLLRLERSTHVVSIGEKKDEVLQELKNFYRSVKEMDLTSPSSVRSAQASRLL